MFISVRGYLSCARSGFGRRSLCNAGFAMIAGSSEWGVTPNKWQPDPKSVGGVYLTLNPSHTPFFERCDRWCT